MRVNDDEKTTNVKRSAMRAAGWVAVCAAFAQAAPSAAAGASFRTPFRLDLSAASARTLLGSVAALRAPAGEVVATLPDQALVDPYAVAIQGISLDLKYAFDTPVPTASLDQWTIATRDVSAQVLVAAIDASQTITRTIGGNTVSVVVQARCENVRLALAAGSTHARATLRTRLTGGKFTVDLADFAADWTPSAWTVTSLNCSGVAGFDVLVGQAIAERLRLIDPFVDLVRAQIRARLDEAVASLGTPSWSLAAAGDAGISLTLRPTDLAPAADGASLLGSAELAFAKADPGKCKTDARGGVDSVPPAGPMGDALTVPYDALRQLVACLSANGSLAYDWKSSDLPGFQSLLGNFLAKLVVWPDLLRWGSGDVFSFDLRPAGEPVLSTTATQTGASIDFGLNGDFAVSVSAPIDGRPRYFVQLSSSLSGPAHLTVTGGRATFRQDLPASFDFQAAWETNYLRRYRPNTYIATTTIAGYARDWLSATGVSVTLPTWEAPGAFRLSIDGAELRGDGVRATLKLESLAK